MKIFLAILVLALTPNVSSAQLLSDKPGDCRIEHHHGPTICQPGEYAVMDSSKVGPGRYAGTDRPGCATSVPTAEDLTKLVTGISQAYATGNVVAGIHSAVKSDSVTKALEKTIGGHYTNEILKMFGERGIVNAANCQMLVTVVPKEATITANSVFATNMNNTLLKCKIGWAEKCGRCWQAFPETPVTRIIGDSKVTTVVYRNWKHDKSRTAKLVTFYTLPSDITQSPVR